MVGCVQTLAKLQQYITFKVTGICPFNRDIFPEDEYAPSTVTDRPNPDKPPNIADLPVPSTHADEPCNMAELPVPLTHNKKPSNSADLSIPSTDAMSPDCSSAVPYPEEPPDATLPEPSNRTVDPYHSSMSDATGSPAHLGYVSPGDIHPFPKTKAIEPRMVKGEREN